MIQLDCLSMPVAACRCLVDCPGHLPLHPLRPQVKVSYINGKVLSNETLLGAGIADVDR